MSEDISQKSVDAINIPDVLIIPKPYSEIRAHFIQRLKERYDVSITEDEYDDIIKKKPGWLMAYSLGSHKLVWLRIKDKMVLCVYAKKSDYKPLNIHTPAKLVTCLELSKRLPVPAYLIASGFDKYGGFDNEMDKLVGQVISLAEEHRRVGDREFFINNPAHQMLKGLAKHWNLKGYMKTETLVEYFADKYMKENSKEVATFSTNSPQTLL